MKILIVSQYAGSQKHGMVFRNYSLAKEWVAMGHQVTILASSYSHSRNFQPNIKGRIDEEWIEGIRYLWVWGPKLKNSAIGRIVMMFAFWFQSYFVSKLEPDYDIVIASSPHPFLIYPAKKIADKCSAKLIFDIRDLWPLTLTMVGKISTSNPIIKLMDKAESFACCHSDLVLSVPRNAYPYLSTKGLAEDKFLHIGNGAWEPTSFTKVPNNIIEKINEARRCYSRLIGYTGALGIVNDMESLVRALSKSPSDIALFIVGDGVRRDALKDLADELGVSERVYFCGVLEKSSIHAFLKEMDILYAGTKRNQLYEYGVSLTKMNDYMLAGKPIVYAVGDANNPVALSGGGVDCIPEDVESISAGIKKLVSHSNDELLAIGQLGLNWCRKNQLVTQQAKKILDKIEKV
ncbi:glycosyltransferase family 4 protein [Pseudoalteromonas sp. JC3]|uniref:glycosyltransferase family 4 protein n=1 Tax=Pseudoalteromonas sp. JC3 TaxID=2810196 RepID=UPI0019D02D0D|nr:glycosyltransferase family 4 protein [Pseudoalteromonas sp. JC3]MBR8842454.1 glycosyltransferase family 4 protein [Pseudoalteromonas sp. JC3]WJE09427.1 glycosyltransferase family 4 protein [Pseudoalteromonas sp. JC3]